MNLSVENPLDIRSHYHYLNFCLINAVKEKMLGLTLGNNGSFGGQDDLTREEIAMAKEGRR